MRGPKCGWPPTSINVSAMVTVRRSGSIRLVRNPKGSPVVQIQKGEETCPAHPLPMTSDIPRLLGENSRSTADLRDRAAETRDQPAATIGVAGAGDLIGRHNFR
jgi:hypothetical protein